MNTEQHTERLLGERGDYPHLWKPMIWKWYDEEQEENYSKHVLVAEWWEINRCLYAIAIEKERKFVVVKIDDEQSDDNYIFGDSFPFFTSSYTSLVAARLALVGANPGDFETTGILEQIATSIQLITDSNLHVITESRH